MGQVFALALGGRTNRIDVVQQLARTVQHLLLVALERPGEVTAEPALAGCTQ